MAYEVAICGDEKEQIESISAMVRAWEKQSGHACHLHLFPSEEAFLFEYEENKTYDILLLDIQMKGISGMDLARRLRQKNARAEIIFITSYFEFAGEGYEVDALHYISIYTEEKEYKVRENISSFQERLSGGFFRIHRSYLVSLKHITKISRTLVCIEGQKELPLARGKYHEVNRAFIECW